MKKLALLVVVVVGILGLTGCKGTVKKESKKLTKEQVIKIVKKSEDKVTYIKEDADAEVKVTGGYSSNAATTSSKIDGEMIYKKGVLKELLSTVRQNNSEVKTYATGDKIYVKSGVTNRWQDISSTGTLRTGTTYIPAVSMFETTVDDFKMKKKGNNYIFTFKGSGEKMFDKIKSFYNLRLSSVSPADSKLELTYVVDAKKKYLKEVVQKITAEKNNQTVKMNINAIFKNYNEKTKLTAPGDISI